MGHKKGKRKRERETASRALGLGEHKPCEKKSCPICGQKIKSLRFEVKEFVDADGIRWFLFRDAPEDALKLTDRSHLKGRIVKQKYYDESWVPLTVLAEVFPKCHFCGGRVVSFADSYGCSKGCFHVFFEEG